MSKNEANKSRLDGPNDTVNSTLRKGLLWQHKDGGIFTRWKERYFILTKDYLSCFKKASSLSFIGSEMGSFLYKVNLVEVASIEWKCSNSSKKKKSSSSDKNNKDVITIVLIATGERIDLWSSSKLVLNEWMFSLKEASSKSKGRREAFLKKSQTLCIPQQPPSQPFALSLWATTRDEKRTKNKKQNSMEEQSQLEHWPEQATLRPSLERASSSDLKEISVIKSYNSLKAISNHNQGSTLRGTPVIKNRKRISLLSKDSDLTKDQLLGGQRSSEEDPDNLLRQPTFGPRLAPQCKGISSLVSLDRRLIPRTGLGQPCSRSVQVSPALAQRSLYAQHILSSPEAIPSPVLSYVTSRRTRDDFLRHMTGRPATGNTLLKSATSEFSFIRPDSPLTLPYNKSKSFYGRPLPPAPGHCGTLRGQDEPLIPPPRATTLNRGLQGPSSHMGLPSSRPSSYHYEGESLEDMVSQLKLGPGRRKRMNRILEKTSQQFSQ
ncbi:hypothetical protein HDE_06829 [Halotydeus destructor]|nr:hypothetical protein HDE_06829 [Halotydeus destructor]